MIELPPPYRMAGKDDALAMAELVDMAGEGLPLYLWSGMASQQQSPWAVGQERAQRESGAFSYRNTIVREESGKVVASLVGYPLDDNPDPVDYDDMPAMFVPLQQLEDMVPGTWYVNVLATYPQCRGRGYGSELLALAEAVARDCGKRGLSIIVADTNCGARKLYQRTGYLEHGQREMVKEDWQHPGVNWILLLKEL